ncbi:hypothetical protein MEQU1_000387 [Malassezia equina]|uniref:Exosome complex protein n=1 Tax=Malassezia equina TaxID=1381935 RepID=A0AAF0E8I9_9BASI|nr:hypothetical protein MEQU1_000387 [Malassezia equina]
MASYAHTVGDPSGIVSKLEKELDSVDQSVKKAFDRPLNEILKDCESRDATARTDDADAPLQHRLSAAKSLVSASYVYLDAIWMYLKSKGVDPTTHPVHRELERVQAYFPKLKETEHPQEKPKQRVDGDAVKRMVTAATGTHTRFDDSHAVDSLKPSSKPAKERPTEEPPRKKSKSKKAKKAQGSV